MASAIQLVVLLGLSGGLCLDTHLKPKCGKKRLLLRCPDGWIEIQEECYYVHSKTKMWADAETECKNEGGNLVSLKDHNEISVLQALVARHAGKIVPLWTAGYHAPKDGVWLWSYGERFNDNLAPVGGQMRDCLELGNDGALKATKCSAEKAFLCKKLVEQRN